MKKNYTLKDSFNFAIEGIIEALKSEKHMKIHIIITMIVIFLAMIYKVNEYEVLILSISISLVLVTELLNTAVETTVDISCKSYNILAKKAKDIAAGAVLISAINSVVVGYIIFNEKVREGVILGKELVVRSHQDMALLMLSIIIVVVIVMKSFFKKGVPLSGGMPSGHSAIASSIWVMSTILSESIEISILTFMLFFLVIQSRVEGKIHSVNEVLVGSILGALITYILFSVLTIG